jgi:hypothetical protein
MRGAEYPSTRARPGSTPRLLSCRLQGPPRCRLRQVTAAEGFSKQRLFSILDQLEQQTSPIMRAARERLSKEKVGCVADAKLPVLRKPRDAKGPCGGQRDGEAGTIHGPAPCASLIRGSFASPCLLRASNIVAGLLVSHASGCAAGPPPRDTLRSFRSYPPPPPAGAGCLRAGTLQHVVRAGGWAGAGAEGLDGRWGGEARHALLRSSAAWLG